MKTHLALNGHSYAEETHCTSLSNTCYRIPSKWITREIAYTEGIRSANPCHTFSKVIFCFLISSIINIAKVPGNLYTQPNKPDSEIFPQSPSSTNKQAHR